MEKKLLYSGRKLTAKGRKLLDSVAKEGARWLIWTEENVDKIRRRKLEEQKRPMKRKKLRDRSRQLYVLP